MGWIESAAEEINDTFVLIDRQERIAEIIRKHAPKNARIVSRTTPECTPIVCSKREKIDAALED